MKFDKSDLSTWSPLLTVKQVSEILNVNPWTLRKWGPKLASIRIGIGKRKDRRYRKEDILKIIRDGM